MRELTRSPAWVTLVVLLLAIGALFIETFGFIEVPARLGRRLVGNVCVMGRLLPEPVVDGAVVGLGACISAGRGARCERRRGV